MVQYPRSHNRFQEEIQRLKDQLAGQGGAVDADGVPNQVFQTFRYRTLRYENTLPLFPHDATRLTDELKASTQELEALRHPQHLS